MKLKDLSTIVFEGINEHSQTLTGVLALVGLGSTIYFTYTRSPEIHEIFDERATKLADIIASELSDAEKKAAKNDLNKDTAKKLVKSAGPVAMSAAITSGLMVATIVISNNKIDQLSSVATISDTAYKAVSDKIEVEERRKREPVIEETEEQPEQNEKGKYLFIDAMFGNLFYSTIPEIKEAVIQLNDRLMVNDGKRIIVEVNELYLLIHANKTQVGYDFMWCTEYSEAKIIIPNVGKRTCNTQFGPAYVLDYGANPPVYKWE